MPLLLVWLFLTVTKLKSIEVPEPDFTLSTSGCGPCWESAPPNEVLVFIPALLMAGAHHVFPWEPGIHYLAFFCVCLSFYIFLSHDGVVLCLCKCLVQEFPFSGTPITMEVSEGAQGWLCGRQSRLLPALLTCPGSAPGGRARGRNWSGLCP